MYNITVLRKLGKILVVEADSDKAKRRAEALRSEVTSVEVVKHEFQALVRLGSPNHGFSLVFLGNRPLYPDAARQEILNRGDLFEQTN